ncbi:choice-of-anchor J domain-containing protein [bacterium]|nr:choice-of-anchor J domain-containing protein [candidate division CSSED10-310 bacterium]
MKSSFTPIATAYVLWMLIGTGPVWSGFIPLSPGAATDDPVTIDSVEVPGRIDLFLHVPGVKVTDIDGDETVFQDLSLGGAGWMGDIGAPRLPFKGLYLEIPLGAQVSMSVSGDTQALPGTFTIMPNQPPELDCSERGQAPDFAFDPAAYTVAKPVPGTAARIAEDGMMRNHRVIFLEIFPIQYTPATGIVSVIPQMTVTLTWPASSVHPNISSTHPGLTSDVFDSMATRIVSNLNSLPHPNDPLHTPRKLSRPVTRNGADYLIVTADMFADELLPLVEWKTLKGYTTRLVTLSEIGAATPAAIETYLLNAMTTWNPAPVYVLLVGDVAQLPPKTVSPDAYGDAFPSDLPYSTLIGSDYFPDLFIGRFSVATESQCTTVVNKILGYDRTPEVADWYRNGLIAAYLQDEDAPYCEADRWFFETAMHVYAFLGTSGNMNMFTALCTSASGCSSLYYRPDGYPHRPAHPSQVPQAYVDMITPAYQARDAITNAINAGVSIVQHRDHGGETSWGDPPYSVTQINALTNGNRLPVVFSLNCLTGAMDYGSDCFAEAFQKHSGGGAVGVVGATRVSYSGYNDLLCHGIYTGMFPNYDTSHSGNIYGNSVRPCEALVFGKYYMSMYEGLGSSTQYTYRLFHWFGDPEMMLRTDVPVAPDVEIPVAIPAGTDIVSLPVAEDGARVAVSQEGQILGCASASGGIAIIPLDPPVQPGIDVTLVVTGYNLLPFETTIPSGAPDCGIVAFDVSVMSCSASASIQIMDSDLNLDPMTLDTLTATVFSDSDPAGIPVVCTEVAPDLGIFTGTFMTGSGYLEVAHGDDIILLYLDEDCNGQATEVTESIMADCIGPAIGNIQIVPGASSVTVTWATNEPAISRLYYGAVYPPDQVLSGQEYITQHSLTISGLAQCEEIFLFIAAEDEAGNETISNNSGAGYLVTTYQEVAVMDEPLIINPQWETQGMWAWGVPAGQGGDHGSPDPDSGYTGSCVYGYNLNGDYPASMAMTEYLVSPSIDCSTGEFVTLSFWGWVGVEKSEYDHIVIDVSTDNGATWNQIYENPYAISFDGGAWTYWEFDLSSSAVGAEDVRIRWGMGPTDVGWQYCGWNIDDIRVVLTGECGTIPTPPPTPTSYPTNTPYPTFTPTPTPTPSPPETPTATPSDPTPVPTRTPSSTTGVTLEMPSVMFATGDMFSVQAIVTNAEGRILEGYPLFVILDVYGHLFYAPSFSPTFDHYLSLYPAFEPGDTPVVVLPAFPWPAGAGQAEGIRIYGALTNPGMNALVGAFDMKTFGWK